MKVLYQVMSKSGAYCLYHESGNSYVKLECPGGFAHVFPTTSTASSYYELNSANLLEHITAAYDSMGRLQVIQILTVEDLVVIDLPFPLEGMQVTGKILLPPIQPKTLYHEGLPVNPDPSLKTWDIQESKLKVVAEPWVVPEWD